jgi:heptosyltransferase I
LKDDTKRMDQNAAPERILIIRLSSLGDILHTLPAFQDLRSSFPRARVDWIVEKRMGYLLAAFKGIDEVIEIDTLALRKKPWESAHLNSIRKSVSRLRSARYDLSIDFQGLLKTACLGLFSGAKLRIGFGNRLVREKPAHWMYHRVLPSGAPRVHITEMNRQLASLAGAQRSPDSIEFNESPADRENIVERMKSQKAGSYVVINPGGGWPTKRWPARRYGMLAQRIIRDMGLAVAVTTGPGEGDLFREIRAECPDPRLLHFNVDFLKLIPLFRSALAVIGGDTGPFHLACAMKVPVVGIFGATDPERNGPWSPVDGSVTRVLPCSFCHRRKCPTQIECLDIPAEDVLTALEQRLKKAFPSGTDGSANN